MELNLNFGYSAQETYLKYVSTFYINEKNNFRVKCIIRPTK